MFGPVTISDIAAAISLPLSAYAVWTTVQFNRRQTSLIETQDLLNKRLLEQSDREIIEKNSADVGAVFVKIGRGNYRLRILNKGKSPARNVNMSVMSEDSPISESETQSKLPMEVLEQHQSVELIASVHMQTPAKHTVHLSWEDETSKDNQKTVYLTL